MNRIIVQKLLFHSREIFSCILYVKYKLKLLFLYNQFLKESFEQKIKDRSLTSDGLDEFLLGVRLHVLNHDNATDLNILNRSVMATLDQLDDLQLLT